MQVLLFFEMENNPIGIFDSGIGGLTVAHAIQEKLPNEQLIYFGDTAHLPYGDKEPYSIKHYSTEIAKFLLEKKVKLIVIACHTASSVAFKEVSKVVGNRALVLNVVDPVIAALQKLRDPEHLVGIIGTKGTIGSNIYPHKLSKLNKSLKLACLETPLLCPMIEEGFINDQISQTVINTYLSEKVLKNITHMVLACTHYPLIKAQITHYYKGNINIIDPSEVVAETAKNLLKEANLLRKESSGLDHHFYVSDYTQSFEQSTRYFFGEKVTLEKGNIWS